MKWGAFVAILETDPNSNIALHIPVAIADLSFDIKGDKPNPKP